MEFPITRERLLNFSGEYKEFQNAKVISKIVEVLTHKIFEVAGRQNNSIRMIQVMLCEFQDSRNYRILLGVLADYIPQIITNLQERFPDIDIAVDPMKTYLYIDWS
jgi:hypothetical protein